MLTTNSFFFPLFFCNPPHLVRMMRHPKHTSHRLLFNGLPTSCSESTARCWGATFQTFQLLVWLSAFQNMRTYAAGRAHRRKFKAVPEGEKVAKKNMASLTKRFLRGFWPPRPPKQLHFHWFYSLHVGCWLAHLFNKKKCFPCFLLELWLITLSIQKCSIIRTHNIQLWCFSTMFFSNRVKHVFNH